MTTPIDTAAALCAFGAETAAGPRAVDPALAEQFREMVEQPCATAPEPGATPTAQLSEALDIEKVLMANMPAHDASPAEFAMGLLRAQVKVCQAAVGIELVSKTTQSLSQGVQSLTARG
jgi:hypothetical protein